MKKTVKVIEKIDAVDFESAIQKALDEGYDLKSSSVFQINDINTKYVAVLIKEENLLNSPE